MTIPPEPAQQFTTAEIVDGLWQLYRDHCRLRCRREGLARISYPDMEAALRQLEERLTEYDKQKTLTTSANA